MSFGVMAPTVVEQAGYTIKAGATNGPWVSVERWRRAAVRVPAGALITTLTFSVSNDHDGKGVPAYALRDQAGVALAQTVVADKWFPLLPALCSYRFARITVDAAPAADLPLILSYVDGPATWRRVAAPIANGSAGTPMIDLGGASAGSFLTPAAFQGATVTFRIGPYGDHHAAVDATGADITQATGASQLLTLPREAFGAGQAMIVAATQQGAARVMDLWLKQEG